MTTDYFKRPRIVLVDDDSGRVEYLENQLFRAGFQTVTMATGALDAIMGNERQGPVAGRFGSCPAQPSKGLEAGRLNARARAAGRAKPRDVVVAPTPPGPAARAGPYGVDLLPPPATRQPQPPSSPASSAGAGVPRPPADVALRSVDQPSSSTSGGPSF